MKNLFVLIAFAATVLILPLQAVEWTTDYNAAVNRSKSESKPIVLFFTGSDWCSWCTKLEREALDTPEFDQLAGNRFVFVKLDFPRKRNLPDALSQQNSELQQKYNIRGFPTLVIIDADGNTLGQTGYRAGGGTKYAEHLLNMR